VAGYDGTRDAARDKFSAAINFGGRAGFAGDKSGLYLSRMTTRNDIVEAARSLQGMQWLHQGRNERARLCGLRRDGRAKVGAVPDIEFENNYAAARTAKRWSGSFENTATRLNGGRAARRFLCRQYRQTHWHCMIVSKREENLETEFYVIEAGAMA
jgi:hypothetical protein